MQTLAIVVLSVMGGVFLMALFMIVVMLSAEHSSRRDMTSEQRQAASDSYRAAIRGDKQGIREAEDRLSRLPRSTPQS